MDADDSRTPRRDAPWTRILQRGWRVAPGPPGRLGGVNNDSESIQAPQIRSLVRWGVPFHFAVPVVCALVGLLLLAGGGAAGWIGGWWLVVALPISIGALFRDPRFAGGPAVVWLVWVIVVAISGSNSGVAHTPLGVAIALAIVGAAATRVAQFAIFPATARDAWEPAVQRLTHPGDRSPADEASDDDESEPDAEAESPAAQPIDLGQMTVSMDALSPIDTAEHDELLAAVEEHRGAEGTQPDALEVDAVVAAVAEAEAEDEPNAETADLEDTGDEPGADPDRIDDEEPGEPTIAAVAVAPTQVVEGPKLPAPRLADQLADAAGAAAIADAEPEPQPEPKVVHVELPLDADPTALDEGGHVLEFSAITEADLEAASAPQAAQPGSDVP